LLSVYLSLAIYLPLAYLPICLSPLFIIFYSAACGKGGGGV
jgi:hypothetical protein